MVVTRGEGRWGRMKRVKVFKYMVTEDQTLSDEHTMEHTDDVL